jgi:hypothetical protein
MWQVILAAPSRIPTKDLPNLPNEVPPQASGESQPETADRRKNRRRPGKAVVHVVRERDFARKRIPAKLLELSVAGIGLISSAQIETNEQISISLQNEVQRIKKEVRGVVRWMSPTPDGEFRLGVALSVRLSPNDLQSLTRVGIASEAGAAKIWM